MNYLHTMMVGVLTLGMISCKNRPEATSSNTKNISDSYVDNLCPLNQETFDTSYQNTTEYKTFMEECTLDPHSIVSTYAGVRALGKDFVSQIIKQGKDSYKKLEKTVSESNPETYERMSFEELKRDIELNHSALSASKMGNVHFLINGTESFKQRHCLIQNAKKSIWIAVWAFYEDETGCDTAYQLIQKRKSGTDVRIVVDGNISRFTPLKNPIVKMKNADPPVQVLEWKISELKKMSFGMHRKTMIIDGKKAIIGGMNFGNAYSHISLTNELEKWRDTDALVTGSAVEDAQHIFANSWNYVLDAEPNKFTAHANKNLKRINDILRPSYPNGDTPIIWLQQRPTMSGSVDDILLATLKIIANAKQTIDISNAYYISTPILNNALIRALKRGVAVRLYTNSERSIDVPSLTKPIFLSVNKLLAEGAEAYLRQTSTTHSKFIVVDNKIGWIGSYNLHPRSIAYEEEEVMMFFSSQTGQKMTNMFIADIQHPDALKYTKDKQIKIEKEFLFDFLGEFIFEAL